MAEYTELLPLHRHPDMPCVLMSTHGEQVIDCLGNEGAYFDIRKWRTHREAFEFAGQVMDIVNMHDELVSTLEIIERNIEAGTVNLFWVSDFVSKALKQLGMKGS